jgi:hypothetical protein
MTQKAGEVRVKTREIIISQYIEKTRREIIKNEIRTDILFHLKSKLKDGKLVENNFYTLEKIENEIYQLDSDLIALTEWISYLKEISRSTIENHKFMEHDIRKNIVYELLDATRAEIINDNIRNDFLLRVNDKNIDCSVLCIPKTTDEFNESIPFLVETLNYLKDFKESIKADRIALSSKYNFKSAEC